MNARLLLIVTMMLSTLLTGCYNTHQSPVSRASHLLNKQSITTTTSQYYPEKTAQQVTLYTNEQLPHTAYRVIGLASISKTNLFGMQRKSETLNHMMKTLAASIGGDGVIDITENPVSLNARVIAFQKIMI